MVAPPWGAAPLESPSRSWKIAWMSKRVALCPYAAWAPNR
jgi:hypothetical protein